MWIGVDDTDGPDGGCTTYVLSSIVAAAARAGFDLIGYPKLVRLDPNVPWKTRGNGALAARFGHGRGRSRIVGEIGGHRIRAFARGRPLTEGERSRLFELAAAEVRAGSSDAPRTDPALVGAPRRPSSELYRQAVAQVVPRAMARTALRRAGGRAWFRNGSRGLVGATAAIAWPARRRTYELLTYRSPQRIGRPRQVDPTSVRDAAARHPSLFLCHDPRTRRMLVAPHTDCPILYGIRSTEPGVLGPVRREIRSEPVDRWLIFETNQGTGDHLVPRGGEPWPAYAAGSETGTVGSLPVARRGGHVQFQLTLPNGTVRECWTFEPTKTLVPVARSLRPGDRVRIDAGRGRSDALHVEGITILNLGVRRGPARPPRCAACDRTAASRGSGRGFRCPACRSRFPPEAAIAPVLEPTYRVGRYDPTPSARRHLHPRVPERR